MHNPDSKKHTVPDNYEWTSRHNFLGKNQVVYWKKLHGRDYWFSQLNKEWVFNT